MCVLYVCIVCDCICACVRVCGKETGREREGKCVCGVWYVCMCVCILPLHAFSNLFAHGTESTCSLQYSLNSFASIIYLCPYVLCNMYVCVYCMCVLYVIVSVHVCVCVCLCVCVCVCVNLLPARPIFGGVTVKIKIVWQGDRASFRL